ncbi:Transport protein particle (TRAPP) component [Trinorchestia longiramus]|nr:Transport protein particle (TRAPP) component [Trinorchestia longiramus]
MEAVKYVYDQSNNEKQTEDEATSKLEHMGFSTGYRLADRLSRESLRFSDELDLLKYVCKVVWSAVYRKEVDNLRTNHQGFYVLHDNTFRFFTSISRSKQYLEQAPKYLAFPCGIVRGALANLGVQCVRRLPSLRVAATGAGVAAATGAGVAPTGAGVVAAGVAAAGVAAPTGAGVAAPTGAGVAAPTGAGVAAPTGAGVAAPTGAGVAAPTGAGVAAPTGAGVAVPTGAGVAAPTGAGVAAPTGAGVARIWVAGVSPGTSAGGCATSTSTSGVSVAGAFH